MIVEKAEKLRKQQVVDFKIAKSIIKRQSALLKELLDRRANYEKSAPSKGKTQMKRLFGSI